MLYPLILQAFRQLRSLRILIYSKNDEASRLLSSKIMERIITIAPDVKGWNRGVNSTERLAETTRINAPSILIEYAFHDQKDDAKWIIDNTTDIGHLTAQGIISFLFETSK